MRSGSVIHRTRRYVPQSSPRPPQRKKYAERPGPPFPANAKDCRGTIRIGNDGAAYESVADSNGVYRWKNIDK